MAKMRVCVIYNYPTKNFGPEHATFAERFIESYERYPPLYEHATVVISNGGRHDGKAVCQFSRIKGTQFIPRENFGMDIGGYQLAARSLVCDMMVFFGGASYIRGPGWLARMASAFESMGKDHLYGCTGNQGDNRSRVWPHVRTTGFWCSPKLINQHPYRVKDNSQRYPYEHGPEGLTSWVLSIGRQAWIVGWHDIRSVHKCDSMPEGFHQGTQANIMVGDRLTCPPYYHVA